MRKTNHLRLEFFTGGQIIQSSLWSTSVDEFNDSAEIVLVGNFNLSDIDWSTVFRDTDLNCRLLDILLDHLMSKQVLEPTRGKNILDLVITTNKGLIRNLEVGEPFSDHNSIAFEVTMSSSKNPSHKKVNKFTKDIISGRVTEISIIEQRRHAIKRAGNTLNN